MILGIPYCTMTQHQQDRRAPDNPATPGRPYDSIFAEGRVARRGDQIHNEYVVFDSTQIYPDYIVNYSLQF